MIFISLVLFLSTFTNTVYCDSPYKFLLTHLFREEEVLFQPSDCRVPDKIKQEIQQLKPDVQKIVAAATSGAFKGHAYGEMAAFVKNFSWRMSGTDNLNKAIEYLKEKMTGIGGKVQEEPVKIRGWLRGKEYGRILYDNQEEPLQVMAMGGSISTPKDGLSAPVVMFYSLEELNGNKTEQIKGKMVVMNLGVDEVKQLQCFALCPDLVASKQGVATLFVTGTNTAPDMIHTDMIIYNLRGNVSTALPAASITTTSAKTLQRLLSKGKNVNIKLQLETQDLKMVDSKNLYMDLKGTSKADQMMVISAHSDSWDISEGAMDDASGVFTSIMAVKLIKELGLKTKRTVRTIIFTGTEMGSWGGYGYYEKHLTEANKISLMLSADSGVMNPRGIKTMATHNASCIIQEILNLLSESGNYNVRNTAYPGADIDFWRQRKVPLAGLDTNDQNFRDYHHTKEDKVSAIGSGPMDRSLALYATVTYAVAQLQDLLPAH